MTFVHAWFGRFIGETLAAPTELIEAISAIYLAT
jgi:hypothetical protein